MLLTVGTLYGVALRLSKIIVRVVAHALTINKVEARFCFAPTSSLSVVKASQGATFFKTSPTLEHVECYE